MIPRPIHARSAMPRFGRGRPFLLAAEPMPSPSSMASDLQLFATWFLGGFLFVSIYLA